MILYASTTVAPDTNAQLVNYIVPARGAMQCPSIIVWGSADGEYSLYKNGTQIGGGRTSTSQPTMQLNFGQEVGLAAFYVLSLYGKHNESTDQILNCSVFIEEL